MGGTVRQRHRKACPRLAGRKKCDCPWQARYADPFNTTRKVERTFRTRQEAEDWLVAQRSSVLQGTHINPRESERPFRDVIAAWKESWPHRLSPTTAARYQSIIDTYLVPEFATTPVGRLTHEVVQRYVNRLAARDDISPGTVRNVYAVFRNAMSRGVRLGMVRVNPCTKIDLPRSPREEMLFLDANEVRKVAEKIDPFYKTLVWTAAFTGLRAGELLALRRRDVDLLRGVIHVRRALKDVGGRQLFGETKNHEQRTVALPKFLREMLAEHLSSPGLPDALVLASKTGKPLRHNLFYRRHFKKAVKAVLPAEKHGLRFHDLRHTAASLAVAAGAHPKMIQEMLGHSSITITLDRYSHLYPSAHEALAEQLEVVYQASQAETASNVVEMRS